MKGKEEFDLLIKTIKQKMVIFGHPGAKSQDDEFFNSLKEMTDNFLEGHLTDKEAYFVGRYQIPDVVKTNNKQLEPYIAKQLGIFYVPGCIQIQPTRSDDFKKVYLRSITIQSHINSNLPDPNSLVHTITHVDDDSLAMDSVDFAPF